MRPAIFFAALTLCWASLSFAQPTPPQIQAAVDAASLAANAPLAPGGLVSLFGANLASSQESNAALPLPTDLANTEVYVNGELAPLLFVSENQINFQLPYGLEGETATIVVSHNGVLSEEFEIRLAQASPAIFTLGDGADGTAAVLRLDGTLVGADSPVEPGEILNLFANSLGAVEPSVASGEPAPATPPLARVTAEVEVTVDGEPAEVLFAGLAPNFVGLYQLNVRAPGVIAVEFPRVQIHMLGAVSNAPTIGAAPLPPVEIGTHFAEETEFQQVADLGMGFVVSTVGDNPDEWDLKFDSAQAAGIKLIVGMFPEPYRLTRGAWTITAAGRRFIEYAASRSEIVKGIFVYNEPYWISPFTRRGSLCGSLSADELRALRTEIRQVWPEAKIFQDVGAPKAWLPGSDLVEDNPCIGDKFVDQRGVADFVGIFNHNLRNGEPQDLPAETEYMREQIEFVENEMEAEAIVDMQAFGCTRCDSEPIRMPTAQEFRAWQCALRELGPYAISYYPWNLELYDEALSDRPDLWELIGEDVCRP